MDDTDIDMLSESIWSTVKLRCTLLLIAVLGFLILWSALEQGNGKAQQVDVKYCNQLGRELPKLFLGDPTTLCHATPEGDYARAYLEQIRSSTGIPTTALLLSELYHSEVMGVSKDLDNYDRERRQAYILHLHLSGATDTTVDFSALVIAEIAPFIGVGLFAVVIILGFQEEYYKQRLANLLGRTEGDQRLIALARSQFLVGIPRGAGEETDRHLRAGAILPESLMLWGSYILFIASFALLLKDVTDNVVHLTDSVFFSYSFLVYAVVFFAAWLLFEIRNDYRLLGGLSEKEKAPTRAGVRILQRWPWLNVAAIGCGLVSFGLPWLLQFAMSFSPWPHIYQATVVLHGYQFLIREQRIVLNNNRIMLAPRVFKEIQLQLYFAICFLIVCVFRELAQFRKSARFQGVLNNVCLGMSIGVVFLVLNYCMYMFILWDQLTFGVAWPHMFPDLEFSSLINFAPAYGFLLFTTCCGLLVWSSFAVHRQFAPERCVPVGAQEKSVLDGLNVAVKDGAVSE